MHRKLALILAVFVTLIGPVSQARAAQPAAPMVPTAPSGLAASPTGSSVSLTWTNNATIPAATAVQIERADDAGFTKGVTYFAVGPNATSYTDTSVVAGTAYHYRVLAQTPATASSWSNPVSILRPASSVPVALFGKQFACSSYCAGSFGWSGNASVITADHVPAGA